MHFLHIVQLYQPVPSGAARYFIEVGRRLVAEGHKVTVLATDAFDLEHLWLAGKRRVDSPQDYYDGVRVLRFPVQRIPGPSLAYPLLRRLMVELGRLPGSGPLLRRLALLTPRLPKMRRYLDTSPDLADVALVHTTNITLDFAIIPAQNWASSRGIPHICTPFVHLGEPDNSQLLRYYSMRHQIELLRGCRAVIAQTDLERSFLQRAGVQRNRISTVGVGVTPAELAGGNGDCFRAAHGIDGPLLLTIGTAAYDKGTHHVVQALEALWAQRREVTWVQIGPLMGHFEAFYAGLPAASRARIRLLGFVDDQTRRDALAAADVFALPSRTDSFGIVFMEAWCYGVPVIGARAGGVPEVIADGSDGLLVPFGNVPALAATIALLLDDRRLAHDLGAAGRAKVLREMTWEHKYALVRQVYRAVTESAPPAAASQSPIASGPER